MDAILPTGRLLEANVLHLSLPLQAIVNADLVGGSPCAGATEVATIGAAQLGIWEMTEGIACDTEVDEIFVVLSGSGEVEFADGERINLSPGVAVRLYAGERTTWTIHTTLRKLYVIA